MYVHEKKVNNIFVKWLLISLILIFSIIIVGGLTRLTNSGLSIVEWELFKGILPPTNKSTWIDYFELYKSIPQYTLINYNMSLNEFKIIFYWEYFHRILGRIIGLFFLLPLIYFHFFKKINKKYLPLCYLALILIIFQGVIGWYMVKSGLINNTTVSHYRLSLHLCVALIIFSIIFWMIINIKNNTYLNFFNINKKNNYFLVLIVLLFLQIVLGAFVSGLDAGKIYQSWPLMDRSYFPDDIVLIDIKSLTDFNNHSIVQFYHRNLAYIITAYVLILIYYIFKNKMTNLYKPALILLIVLLLQVLLGILTLLSDLNILLASSHQITSVLFIMSTIYLYYYSIK
jgi:heme a synthase